MKCVIATKVYSTSPSPVMKFPHISNYSQLVVKLWTRGVCSFYKALFNLHYELGHKFLGLTILLQLYNVGEQTCKHIFRQTSVLITFNLT